MDTNTLYWIAGAVVLFLLYRNGYLDSILALLQRPSPGTEKAQAPAAPAAPAQASAPQTVVVRVEDGRVTAGSEQTKPVEQVMQPPLPVMDYTATIPAEMTVVVKQKGS